MKTIFKQCDLVIKELSRFSAEILFLGNNICDERLEQFESEIKFDLPEDFKYILKKHNGFSLSGTQVYGLDKEFRGASINEIYRFEHHEVDNKMPSYILPFSPDGRGNHYCLNLSKNNNGICPVIFWQWDLKNILIDQREECNDNFISWVKEVMIEWTLEDYNYDGSEK